jgi:hypothetical protein
MGISTDFVQTAPHGRWTFETTPIREWVESKLSGRVLNACAGKCRLTHTDAIIRNDKDTARHAEYHLDVAKLPTVLDPESFETIVFDPPWSLYQANLRYDGRHVHKENTEICATDLPQTVHRDKSQVGHARLAKDGFDYLLADGGVVIQLAYTGTCMPSRLQYEQSERVMFDPVGEAKTLIGSVDRKVQTKLC